eukprot:TRINITY_DN25741_c0_g1_i1.p1 TRINITY_DN25741_c0_g1~~TRINITY_DN25741_c0_g1_i1.p1  ORF type:complete len:358 (+),score=90.02 TRINITY_DN25741_c0_g1_i1:83-1156(+)
MAGQEGDGGVATKMRYVNVGKTGLQVSKICLGMMSYGSKKWRPWVLEEQEALPFVKRALELGINFFDTADVYSRGESEVFTGNALRHFNVPRDEVVIASKVYFPVKEGAENKPNLRGLSRKHIMHAVEESLKRLGLDFLDLYQIHRFDATTPIEETMETLNDLVRSGKVRYIGASSMSSWQLSKAQYYAEKRGFSQFVSMQNHYNLIYREEEREMIPLCKDTGMGILPWSPLARGVLAGGYQRPAIGANKDVKSGEGARADSDALTKTAYLDESRGVPVQNNFDIVDRVKDIATKKGISAAQVSLAWVLSKEYVTAPIIGATKMGHLEEAVAALDVVLTPEEIKTLEELYKPHPVSH